MNSDIVVRQLDRQDYFSVWKGMQRFTDERTAETTDEIWTVEHNPVFTLGQNGKREHILDLDQNAIPIIQTDRGGQVTYHGPGQLVVYVLLDIRRRPLGVRGLVTTLEKSVIEFLSDYQITATSEPRAPGVYVAGAKICSLGLRIRRGCSYHGLALNIDMDLTPFSKINPCGFHDLAITQLSHFNQKANLAAITPLFIRLLKKNLGYTEPL